MFEQFTDRARAIVVLAQEEARLLDHPYIGTEHILLGLVREGEGVAALALKELEISLDDVRAQVEKIIGRGEGPVTGQVPFTPRAKKVLELSLREAMQLGHNYIGSEHLLLGLIREGEGIAAKVLVHLGADLDRVRQQVVQLLGGYEGAGAATSEGESLLRNVRRRLGRFTSGAASESVTAEAEFDQDVGPLCAQCHVPLTETIACRELEASVADSESAHPALVVYCGRCGTTLGVLPPPGPV